MGVRRERGGWKLAVVVVAVVLGGGGAALVPIDPVTSVAEMRDAGVVKQKYDFSCGAASVATLVNGFFGEHRTELELLRIARARYGPAEWQVKRREGLSLDDLAAMANKIGYEAEGAEIGLAALLKINGPVIVHLKKPRTEHFTVFRGVKNGAILLADPIAGNVEYTPGQFVAEYSGVALAIWKKGSPLPTSYPFAVSAKDARQQLRHASELLRTRREPLPTSF
jgi:predicted double-glycine peptidase